MSVVVAKDLLGEALEECYLSTEAFCRTFLPETFDVPFSDLHRQMFECLERPGQRKLILAPRGIGKTSIIKALIIRAILYMEKRFIVYISNSLTLAEMQTENIKDELVGNELIRKLYPSIHSSIENPERDPDESFSKKAWVAFGQTLVLPRGMGQQVRGLNWRGYRPDLIVLDDPEDEKELRNEEIRKANKKWFFGTLLKCVSLVRRDWHIYYIDTLKHQDALPVHLKDVGNWDSLTLSICNPQYQTLAPEFMPQPDLDAMIEEHRLAGTMDEFHMEYMNEPVSPLNQGFKRQYFQYYQEGNLTPEDLAQLETVVLVDPAKSLTPSSDDSAVVGVGIDLAKNRFYVRDVFSGKVYPDDLYTQAIEMARRLNARVIGYEITGLGEFVRQPFLNELHRRGATDLEVVELKARRSKPERIMSLVPFYRQGLVWHNPSCTGELEAQLMGMPKPRRDDIADALAYIVEMCDLGGRYFLNVKEDEPYDVEAEYKDLVDEPDLPVGWELL